MSAVDLVVLTHFGFILFVAFGGLPVLRFPKLAWLHVPAAAWGVAVQVGDWVCPLTWLENALRGDAATGSFIERTLMPVIYPDLLHAGVLTPTVRIALGLGVLTLNLAIYGVVVRRAGWRWARWRAPKQAGAAGRAASS